LTLLSSRDNPLIKTIISLKTKKGRRKHQLFLAEGPHLLEEALASTFEVRGVFTNGEILCCGALWEYVEKKRIPVYHVSPRLYAELTETENPQDVLGLIAQPKEQTVFPEIEQGFMGLILDQIQDPGNLGTIIRTSWAAGLRNIFITPGTVDPYSGKVVRSTQGGIFNLQIYPSSLEKILSWAASKGVKVWAADPRGVKLYYQQDFTGPTLFLLGNEARGCNLSNIDQQLVEGLGIPLPGGAESLNVSISAGILIYETLRQRLLQGTLEGEASGAKR